MKTIYIIAMLFSQSYADIRFKQMQDEGTIVYEGNDDDTGKDMYTIFLSDTTIHYAYKGEIKQYINTGSFEYNDFLK